MADVSGSTQTIYAFCSAKGGVGKSSLSVACAKLLAAEGRTCVLIDADLTGTSLADGLRLCAPQVTLRDNGTVNLNAPPTGYLDRAATLELRRARAAFSWTTVPPPPAFLNDALTHDCGDATTLQYKECEIATVLWQHEQDDGVLYVPSSPLDRDVGIALGWLYYEERHAWIRRMSWLIEGMRKQIPGLMDVVIDLPPGLFGFADEMLTLLSHLGSGEALPVGYPPTWNTPDGHWKTRPFLVMTSDRNDVAAGCAYYVRRRKDFPALVPLINRCSEGIESIVASARELFGVMLTPEMFEQVGEIREMQQIFTRVGDLVLTPDVMKVRSALRIGKTGGS